MGRRRIHVAAAAVVVMLSGAPAAPATVVDKGHYTDAYTFAYDDCGFGVEVEGTASGHFRVRAGMGKAGQPFSVYDSTGRLILRDRGSIHHRFLFDTFGDDVPGGELVGELVPAVHGPHPGFETEFCEVIAQIGS